MLVWLNVLPTFQNQRNGFLVTVFNDRNKNVVENVVENVTENVTEKRLLQIITFLELHPKITTIQLSKKLYITRMTLYRELEKLKEMGKIRRNGPDKGGFWKILK